MHPLSLSLSLTVTVTVTVTLTVDARQVIIHGNAIKSTITQETRLMYRQYTKYIHHYYTGNKVDVPTVHQVHPSLLHRKQG